MNYNIFIKDNEVYKFCSKCKIEKLLKTSFYFRKIKNKMKPESACKECKKRSSQERYNPKLKKEINKKYYLQNKQRYKKYWKNNKDKKKIHNIVYRLKDQLGGEKLNRGAKAR